MNPQHRTTSAGTGSADVVLAFDLDGPTGDAMVTGRIWGMPGFFTLGAYGPHRAMPRILDILREHGVPATFFTPAWVVRTWPELARRIVDDGHELAGHGDLHEMFYGRDAADQASILRRSQETFLDVVGQRARGFRAPSGDLAPETPRLLAENGYTYSSSMRSPDRPYLHDGVPLVEIPTKSLFDDYSAFAYHRAPNFPRGLDRVAPYEPTFESWKEEVLAAADEGLAVTTVWHPKVIASPGRSLLLDDFVGSLSERPDVSFVRGEELAASVSAERTSAESTSAENSDAESVDAESVDFERKSE